MMSEDEHDEGMEVEEEEGEEHMEARVFVPGRDEVKEGEELQMDRKAYKVYHSLAPQSSCLSFDLLRGSGDASFPLTMYLVAGTAVTPSQVNRVQVLRISNIRPLHEASGEESEDSESDSDSDSDEDAHPEVEMAELRHNGQVNRVRATEHAGASLAATWSEHGIVYVWDLSRPLGAVNDSLAMSEFVKADNSPSPLFTFNGHPQEGYGMDWSPLRPGLLLTGDCTGRVHLWTPRENAADWKVGATPFTGHSSSVEDIQWSPTEPTVFCTASVDRSLRIWDIRAPPARACQISSPDAHAADVNVVAWNRLNTSLLLSGGDDGHLKVWDLRQFKRSGTGSAAPLVWLKHHADPITAVEWHPTESSVFAAGVSGSRDGDQLTLWDISVEGSAEEASGIAGAEDLPPQLMFVHMGQQELKELHWSREVPGLVVSTAADSFNIFRSVNM